MSSIRLISYNIHKGIGGRDRRYRLERICHVIESAKPDIVCLQEVTRHAHRTGYDDQPEILARRLNANHYCYQMNVHYRKGGYGNLVLSRWPIHRRHDISLRLRMRKPRGAQLAVVDTPRGHLHLTNWHLGLRNYEREWQVRHLLHHPLFRESAHLPTMIVGDFNDWLDRLGRGPLAEHRFQPAASTAVRSFPAFMPILSLDKAFHRGGIHIRDCRVVRDGMARSASDHLPLVIDFNMKAAAEQAVASAASA